MSGSIQLKDLYLWSFEQVSNVRSFDNSPSDHYYDIVALNRKLDDPKTLLSSVSASNATINYLAGAGRPESDGTRKFAWVGPYAKVRLNATAPTIAINGYIDIDMFRKAKLFPAGCTLAASINGKTVAQRLFTANQPIAMNVNIPPESRGVVTLELKNNCSMNPKAMGLGEDGRTLSYIINDIQGESSAEEN